MAKSIPKPLKRLGGEYFKTVSTMLTSAFGLVAALAWNDFIKRVIDEYISPGSSVISQLIYVIIVTTLVVLITMQMATISERFSKQEEAKEEANK